MRYTVSSQPAGRFVVMDLDSYEAVADEHGLTLTWDRGAEAAYYAQLLNADAGHATDCARYIVGGNAPCDCR